MSSERPPHGDHADPPSALALPAHYEEHVRQEAKRALRQKMRALRGSVPAGMRRQRSLAVAERLLALPELSRAQTVLTFLPIQGEPALDTLHTALRARGLTLALTRVNMDTDTLEIARFDSEEALVAGPFGLREPAPEAALVPHDTVDLVLVPGLVMDLRGHRIGYGKGHFDRLLATLPKAFRCGVCYDFQLVGEAPELPHDVPLHAVVTDAQLVRPEADVP